MRSRFLSFASVRLSCFVVAAMAFSTALPSRAANGQIGKVTVLHSFQASVNGTEPQSALIQAGDGNFYGTTSGAGSGGPGTVFQITPAGVVTTLYTFSDTTSGTNPSGLALGNDGNFYGTTAAGGTDNQGTVFQITPSGAFTTLYSFKGTTDGGTPSGALAAGTDGNFYGTTLYDRPYGGGTVFQITPAGALTTLHVFNGDNGSEGSFPSALVRGPDANFYGTTSIGGTFRTGTVFQVGPLGSFATLHSFAGGAEGVNPMGALALGHDGNLYGTTFQGGTSDAGTVFKLTTAGALTTVYNFTVAVSDARSALVADSNGNLYGTTPSGPDAGTVYQVTPGGALTTLHTFTGSPEGANPVAGLAAGHDGNLYGTTELGGADNLGTVFRITPTGTLTTLHGFSAPTGGTTPDALLQAADGNFYGTTSGGGFHSLNGTVFKLTPEGALTTLHSFDPATDGESPHALVAGADGNFYGLTNDTVFQITPGGALTNVLTFQGSTFYQEYTNPVDLIAGSDGNLYGTDYDTGTPGGVGRGELFKLVPGGGFTSLASYYQTVPSDITQGRDGNIYGANNIYTSISYQVFQIAPSGTSKNIYTFQNDNGVNIYPYSLIQAPDGNLYGTTSAGGANNNGTVFQLTTGGVLTTLYNFDASAVDGSDRSRLIQAPDGNFYGTSSTGGANNDGNLFQITPAGGFTVLHDFVAETEGANPGALLPGRDGNFYGVMGAGGVNGVGTVFRASVIPSSTLTLSAASATVNENAGRTTFLVTRRGDGTGAASVNYSTTHGTAAVGTDYVGTTGTLVWADGELSTKTVTVPIIDRALGDGSMRTFALTLAAPAGNLVLPSPASVTVAIQENDAPVVTSATTAAGQAGQAFSYQIAATGTPTSYDATGLPAGLNVDHSTGLISGTPTQSGTFAVELSATNAGGTGTATLPLTVAAETPTVTIVVAGDGMAREGGENGKAKLLRTGDTTAPLTVRYEVVGSAISGVDYQPVSGTAVIPAGATQVKVKIRPIDNTAETGTRNAKVKLLPATDGSYLLGSVTKAKIMVIDND